MPEPKAYTDPGVPSQTQSAQPSSGFKTVSLGIVLSPKEDGSDIILVTPIEQMTMINGPVQKDGIYIRSSFTDKDGVKREVSVDTGGGHEATWLAYGDSNRESSPDVYPGETVLLFQYNDDPVRYWTTLMREPSLRGRERVRFSFSNKDANGVAYDDNTSYWIEYDTKNKRVHLHTSDNDGEATTHDIILDTREGQLSWADGLGQAIVIHSPSGVLNGLMNTSMNLTAPTIVLNADTGTFNITNFTLNGASSEINGDSTTINATTAVNRPLSMNQGFHSRGGEGGVTSRFEGNIELIGNMTGTADINISGNISAANYPD